MMRGVWQVLVVLLAIVAGRVASAERAAPFEHAAFDDLVVPEVEGDEAAALARELASAGTAELASGGWEVAARQLEASYLLDPRPEVLLPLARALHELGNDDAARERLERLVEACPAAGEDPCGRAIAELEGLGTRPGRVAITTEPEGAEVFVDGEARGRTPLGEPLDVEVGEHQLRVVRDGYRELTRTLSVEPGEPLDLVLTLEPAEAPRSRGLDVALWTVVGLAAACAAATAVTAVVGAVRVDDLEASLEPTSADSQAVEGWANASFWLAGATGATSIVAIVLAAVRARRERERQGR